MMAIEIGRHPAFGLAGAAARRRRAGAMGRFRDVCGSVGRCARMALPSLLAIGIIVGPPVVFSVAQSLVAKKGIEQQDLYKEIEANRAKLTRLQDELRQSLKPGVLASWAKSRNMVAPGAPIFIGVTGSEVTSSR